MAGSYPDAPSQRFAWDDDGTILMVRRTETSSFPWMEISPTNKALANNEDATKSLDDEFDPASQFNNHDGELIFIFPELREIDGIYFQTNNFGGATNLGAVDDSADTTNGFDGSFSSVVANYSDPADTSTAYRSAITSTARSAKRALRLAFLNLKGSAMVFRMLHLYGTISPGETPDRLLWIDENTSLEFTLPIDYGDVPRGSARDRLCRLKNNSGSLTANTIQITAEALYGGSGSWYTFDIGGGGFASTRSISSLGSGATSSLITIRQDIPDAASLQLHAARAFANVSSWT